MQEAKGDPLRVRAQRPRPSRASRTRPILEAARKQEATSSWQRGQPHLWGAKLVRAREGLAGGKGHRGEQHPRGPGLPFPSPRGRHRALDPAPPEPRAKPEGASRVPAPAPRGCPGAGRAGVPEETMSAEPHSPAGSQASSRAHQQHPRGAMPGSRPPPPPPPPPPGDVAPTVPPLPWHLSWAGRCLRLQSPPSLPAPSAGAQDKRAADSFKNGFKIYM